MQDINEFLKAFPASFILVGAVVIGIMFWIVNRKILALSREAQKELIEGYKERLDLLQTERDEYRKNLHDERNAHNDTKVRQAELEARPDLTAVFKAYQEEADKRFSIYGQQTSLIGEIDGSLKSTAKLIEKIDKQITNHTNDIEKQFEKHLGPVAEILKKLMGALQRTPAKRRQILPT